MIRATRKQRRPACSSGPDRRRSRQGSPGPAGRWRRRGIVLVLVLVVVVVLSLAAYTFSDLMLSYQETVQLTGKQMQARALVESGAEFLRLYLTQDPQTMIDVGGLYDNPIAFQAIPVIMGEDAMSRANFTIVAPALDEQGYQGGWRYGLEDESTRLNLNALLALEMAQEGSGRELLLALPNMTEDVADAILDWMDEDEEPREFGVETEYYGSLDPPYASKNAPLDTVEELLLVRGVTPQLLFGLDVNRNGAVDSFELNAGANAGPTSAVSADGMEQTERGWSGYLTLHSMEANVNAEGFQRIYVNMEDMEALHKALEEVFSSEWSDFIVAYRQYGPYQGGSDDDSEGGRADLDLTVAGSVQITQILDLIGVKVEVPGQGEDDDSVVLESPFPEGPLAMAGYLPLLMDNVTTQNSPTIPGRININQAPREILMGIPEITEEIVDQILSVRDTEPDLANKNRQMETWILTEGIVTLDEMRMLTPFINAGGDVHRAQVVGYYEDGSASSRAEIVIDGTGSPPRILFWRDISHLGRGYSLETLGVQLIDVN